MKRFVALLLLVGCAAPAAAQDYPSRRITLLVGYSAGGPVDVAARLVAEKLKDRFGQPVIVENRIGGGPLLSFESVKNAAPDGYTLAIATPGVVTLKFTSKAYTLDPLRDFSYVSQITTNVTPLMLFAPANAPYRTLAEFVAYARANPGKVNFGTAGTSLELEVGLLSQLGGFKVTVVPYKGSAPLHIAMAAGEIGAAIDSYGTARPNIEAGRTRVLAVGSKERVAALPEVPSISEAVPGYEAFTNWFGILAPAGMPQEISNRISEAVGAALRQPDVPARLESINLKPAWSRPNEFHALVTRDYERVAKAASLIGLQPQ
jgi:tripartite-type tricarboxylate transporter receptor subunit TctC